MAQRIAYFVNRYPAVSHSFIRREILALEALGFEVLRVALRGWEGELVDDMDLHERAITRYVLKQSPLHMIRLLLRQLLNSPRRFVAALWLALRMGWRGARPLPYHLGYFVEACSVLHHLQEHAATHVHAHFGTNSTEIVMLARALGGPPYSFTVHGPEEFDMPQALGLGEKARQAAFVVAISSFARAQLYRWVDHAHWSKIKVVHCGLEASYFATDGESYCAAPRFVCIGRLTEQKGQLLLLEAAHILAAKGAQFEVVLVGSGELRQQLEAVIRRYALERHVFLTGSLSSARVREEIQRARVLVMPSFAEGLPITIMEAMAARRPVLTTYVAGIPELVLPGETGWLIPAGCVESLAGAMEEALNCPPAILEKMGVKARARVLERHAVEIHAQKLVRYFAESA